MAFTGRLSIKAGEYTLLTAANVSAITVQNLNRSNEVWLFGTPDATQPTTTEGGIILSPLGIFTDDLSAIWREVANGRVYGWSLDPAEVYVSHA